MSTDITAPDKARTLDRVLVQGDLSTLSDEQRINHYMAVCDAVGLNHLTKPFEYIRLNGKLVLYAKKDATDQLRKINGVSIEITKTEVLNGIYVVTAKAKDKNGREDSGIGAVAIEGLKGEAMANAIMKAETKSKRRVTLSICGLGMLDETEVDSVPGAQKAPMVRPDMTAQALADSVGATVVQDIPSDLLGDDVEYRIPTGKFKGKTFRECDERELAGYVLWYEANVKFPNAEFLRRAKEHLGG